MSEMGNDEFEKELEEIKKRLKEREEEDRKSFEESLERERKEQEEIKKRLVERKKEEEESAKRILQRERDELEQAQKIIKEKERQEQFAERLRIKREIREERQRKKRRKAEEKEIRKLIEQSERIFASLRPIGSEEKKGVDTFSGTLPVYYVIVGRGPAAIINHTTLRQTEFGKKRIGGLPVMHIGFANPWTKYMQHGMGQPPHLLNLPGFKDHPDEDAIHDAGLDSRNFADCVEDEYERLEEHYGEEKVITTEAWVVWIQTTQREPLGHSGVKIKDELTKDKIGKFIEKIEKKLSEEFLSKTAAFRLLVMNPKPADLLEDEDIFFIYASYIDICTGPGRPNVVAPGKGDTDECKKARTAPWLSPEKWESKWGNELKNRIVLNGVESIRDEVPWKSGERVCVTAGGGVGLNAAERARNEDCKLDWFGRTSLMDTFANPRNDTILRHPTEDRILRPGESKTLGWKKDDQIIPCKKALRYGYGAVLDDTKLVNSQVEVTLKASGTPKIKDYFDKQVGFSGSDMWDCSAEYAKECSQQPSKLYDRLVLPNGQASRALGHAYFFARHLTLTPLTANDGRMVGLTTGDRKVRVLGAAAQTYDKYGVGERKDADEQGKKMWLFWDSLPVSAVPDGFIFSGINIAVANEYFRFGKPNPNANTNSEEDIRILFLGYFGDVADQMATAIIDGRKRPDNNGYKSIDEIIELLQKKGIISDSPSTVNYIKERLTVAYKKSEDTELLNDV